MGKTAIMKNGRLSRRRHRRTQTSPIHNHAPTPQKYLEPLSRAVPVVIHDPRIDLPEPAALHAVLRVTIDGAAHRVRTEWLMRYRTSSGEVRREEVLGGLDAEETSANGNR